MAAQALIIPDLNDRTALWTRLIDEFNVRVREYNLIAGETVWRVSWTSGPLPRIALDSTFFPECRLECVFDAERGIMVSAPGVFASSAACCLSFSRRGIVYNGRECGMTEVVAQLLDGLAHATEE